MKIKRNSWHYKISNWGSWGGRNDNLCLYFWRLVLKVLFVVVCICAISGFIYLLCIDFYFRFAWVVVLYFLFSVGVSVLAVWFTRTQLGKSPEIPGSNILIEYLKAKKAKICPLIEYTD